MRLSIQPTLLDRAISAVNPKAGLARMAARAQMQASAMVLGGGSGGYRGAQPDRSARRGWFVRPRSANADILPGSDRMRGAQRDAAMNQPIATAAINRKTTFTIGTGLMAIPAIDGAAVGLSSKDQDALEQRIAADFDAYMSSKDVDAERKSTGYGVQKVTYRGCATSGDLLLLRVLPEDQPGRVLSTAWKMVEADRLRNPFGVADGGIYQPTGNKVTGGVEVDAYDAPLAYHVLKQHPGDLPGAAILNLLPERIEAWDAAHALPNVIHVYDKERPEQLRGVGALATVLEPLKMLSDLSDAELFAAVMSAMIAIVYKSPGATPMPEPDYGDGTADPNATPAGIGHNGGPPMLPGASPYRMESGSIMEIDSDADVEIKTPGRPNSAFDPFFQAIVRQIGAAIGVPAGVLLLMFNSSYTASKAELEALYQMVRTERAWFGDDLGKPMYLCFLAEKVARGDYAMPGFFSDLHARAAWSGVDWRGDGKITLNAYQEAQGMKIQQDNGWTTGEQITADLNGGSFKQNIRKRGAEHRAWVAEGLPVAVPPGTPANQAADAAEEAGTNDRPKDEAD